MDYFISGKYWYILVDFTHLNQAKHQLQVQFFLQPDIGGKMLSYPKYFLFEMWQFQKIC